MISLFFISLFLSKNISILSTDLNSTTYFLSKKCSIDLYLSNEYLFILFFLFFFQSIYFGFNTLINTILFYTYMDIHSIPFYHDPILLETKIENEHFFFRRRNILFMNYILLSLFLSKIELGTLFFLLLLYYHGNTFLEKINTYYPIYNFYELYSNQFKQYIKNLKENYDQKHNNFIENNFGNFFNILNHEFDDLPEKFIDDIYYNTKYHGSPRNWTWDPISNTLIVTGNKKNYSSYHFIINKPIDIPDDKINIDKSTLQKNSHGNLPLVHIEYLPVKNLE